MKYRITVTVDLNETRDANLVGRQVGMLLTTRQMTPHVESVEVLDAGYSNGLPAPPTPAA